VSESKQHKTETAVAWQKDHKVLDGEAMLPVNPEEKAAKKKIPAPVAVHAGWEVSQNAPASSKQPCLRRGKAISPKKKGSQKLPESPSLRTKTDRRNSGIKCRTLVEQWMTLRKKKQTKRERRGRFEKTLSTSP